MRTSLHVALAVAIAGGVIGGVVAVRRWAAPSSPPRVVAADHERSAASSTPSAAHSAPSVSPDERVDVKDAPPASGTGDTVANTKQAEMRKPAIIVNPPKAAPAPAPQQAAQVPAGPA